MVKDKLLKPSVFLASEFVIIVLGVLVALAVDNWNETRKNDEIREHLVASLLNDLREDTEDYREFANDCETRARAAQIVLALANGESVVDDTMPAGEALYQIGRTSRLETVESTFREMTARGTGTSIEDSTLRLEISHYYGLARDRSDINDALVPGILRYRAALEEVGISYVDRDDIDVDAVLRQPKVLAVIRELGVWATAASGLITDLRHANQQLIERLEAEFD